MRIVRVVLWVLAAVVALGIILDVVDQKWTALAGDLVIALVIVLILALLRRR